MEKLFDRENRLYKYYLNDIEDNKEGVEFIKKLFKLELIDIDKSEDQDLLQLYNIIGFDKFFEVVTLFSSKNIKIPKASKIKKLLISAIAYYQVNVLNLSPKDAGRILSEKLASFDLRQKSIKSIVNQLQQEIIHLTDKTIRYQKIKEAENGNR